MVTKKEMEEFDKVLKERGMTWDQFIENVVASDSN
jgi:hypothetical protein